MGKTTNVMRRSRTVKEIIEKSRTSLQNITKGRITDTSIVTFAHEMWEELN